MRRRAFVILVLPLLFIAAGSFAEPALYVEIYLGGDTYNELDSQTYAWVEVGGSRVTSRFYFRHWIHLSSDQNSVVEDSGDKRFDDPPRIMAEDRRLGTGLTPNCYRSRMAVTAEGLYPETLEQEMGSSQRCIAPPPSQPPTCKTVQADGTCPPLGSECQPEDEFCNLSPVVLDLAGRGYHLSALDDPVVFDLDGDGVPETTGWTRGAGLAFLALDRNGNGLVDSGSELFGDATPTPIGAAAHGFEAMTQYNSNGDSALNAQDPIWQSLLLWEDANHNGVSESGELRRIAGSAISSLQLDYHWTGRRDPSGNVFRYGAVMQIDGRSRPYYDIFFRVQN